MTEKDTPTNPSPAVDDESAIVARSMVDGAEGTRALGVRGRLFEQAMTLMSENYGLSYHESGGPTIRGYSFFPGSDHVEPAITFLKKQDVTEPAPGAWSWDNSHRALFVGHLGPDGVTSINTKPFLEGWGVARGKVDGFKPISVQSVLMDMLKTAKPDEVQDLARSAVLRYEPRNEKSLPSYYRSLVAGFWKTSPQKFTALLETTHEIAQSGDESEQRAAARVQRAASMVARQLFERPENVREAEAMIVQLDELGMLDPHFARSIEMMANPKIAHILVDYVHDEDIFEDVQPHARRNNAYLLLLKVLEQTAKNPKYNTQNAKVVRDALFKPGSYNNAVSINDLLRLANVVTERTNQGKPDAAQRALLPTGETGAAAFLNAGEAVFRVLSLTAKSREQLAACRDYADLIDALLLPDYKQLKNSRPVTIADIAARYPDAKGDIIIQLQETAEKEGFAAASARFDAANGRVRRHKRFNRHAPGYGIIS